MHPRVLLLAYGTFASAYGIGLLIEIARGRPEPAPRASCWLSAAVAGSVHGAVATGAGAILGPCLLRHRGIDPPARAVGTTVGLVFLASLVAAGSRIDAHLLGLLTEAPLGYLGPLLFAGPGVVLGGQLGPIVARRLPRRALRLWIALLLPLVGALVAWQAVA